MGDPSMALGAEDVRRIVDYAKPWLRDAIHELAPRGPREIDTQLLERIVRVEEELRTQRELMAARFDANDKRFDDLQASIGARFDANDKRFDDLQVSLADRFDANDKRFDDLQVSLADRFDATNQRLDDRFDATNRRLDDLRAYSDKRFAALQWTMMVGFTIVTAAVTYFGLFA